MPAEHDPGRPPISAPLESRNAPSEPEIEERIHRVGREILEASWSATPTVFQTEWWQERILQWTMEDARLRTQLFRFVDVLPSLRTRAQIAEHLREYLLDGQAALPGPLDLALRFGGTTSVAGRVAAMAARRNVRQIAHRFIAGETVAEALVTVQRLRKRRMGFSLDVLGEAVTSEAQAERYARQYLELIDGLSKAAATWRPVEQIDEGPSGPVPRVNLSVKLSALYSHFDPICPAESIAQAGRRLGQILRLARERRAFVHVDMEEYAYKDLILDTFEKILMEDDLRDFSDVGIVIQTYLRDSESDLDRLRQWVHRRGCPITVRLVKGAYWDYEVVIAAQRRWPCPVFTEKHETDASFERSSRFLLAHHEGLRPAIASHNVRSLSHAIVQAERLGLSWRHFEIQLLFGMGDPLKAALVERGLRVRIYTPYGPLIPGMAYLIRRLLENTSNESFLRQSFTERLPVEDLLADPTKAPAASPSPAAARRLAAARASEEVPVMEDCFQNEPLTDFRIAARREAMARALAEVRAQCGATYPLLVAGQTIETERLLESPDPSNSEHIVGRVACASAADADRAVEAARAASAAWRDAGVEARAALLRRLADRMRARRFELAAWIVFESAKPWREADADVAEAIDYCELYAREACRLLLQPRRRDVPGEQNLYLYEPRGVAVIIAPWNFPLAILTGMTTAALVMGNTVVVKPAEQSPVIAAKFFELLSEAGAPPRIASFLPGIGEEVGAHLVAHPAVALIAFTGSKAVGLSILESAARVQPGQRMVKRVITEMGGKNAIIVDADADLDEAVQGVAHSAFSYAGQKCSACSRVIVLSSVHDAFLGRLIETTKSLPVGPAEDPRTIIGPLIDADAQKRVLGAIERGRKEAAAVCLLPAPDSRGFYVGPAVFDQVPPHSMLAQEEIFGPVLSVLTVDSFDRALAVANDVPYGLTGGLYSRTPSHIEQAKRELAVGNLYVNRVITGALVDRQPFGGIKLSGIGSKAGGPDYLRQFCEPRCVSENTMRHGFAPEI